MKKFICLLSFICIVCLLNAQSSIFFVTDGAVGKNGQVLNVPDSPLNKKSTYYKIDVTTIELPDTLLHGKKINLCVSEDIVIQFSRNKTIDVIMPSMDGTKWAWTSYSTGNDRQKYGKWLYDKLDTIQNRLDAYADTLLDGNSSNTSTRTALWMMKVSVNILIAKTDLLHNYYGYY